MGKYDFLLPWVGDFKCNKCCLGVIPIHFFCLVIPVRRSMHTIVLASVLLFGWNFLLSCVMFGIISGLRAAYELPTSQMHTGLSINIVSDTIMIAVTMLFFWRDTHLVWMAWGFICWLLQTVAFFVCAWDDISEMDKNYLVVFTSGRVLAFFDLYFMTAAYFFTWFFGWYFWLCVFSSYQISRLPKNYDDILEEELKDEYEKKRERVANAVYQQMVNEKYLSEVRKMRLDTEEYDHRSHPTTKKT